MENIAILGATSHIAKNIIFYFFKKKKYRLTLFVRSFENMYNFLKIIDRENNSNIGIKSYEEFKREKYYIVLNCAGIGDPSKLKNTGSLIFRLTERFDNLVLDYLEKFPNALYINFSSGAVYGTEFNSFVSENNLTSIAVNNIDSSNFYQIAKINSEAKHRALKSFNIIDLRIFNFFSRFIDLKSKFFISEVLSCIKQERELKTGPEEMIRDYVHPMDLINLIEKCIEKHFLNNAYDVYSLRPVKKFTVLDYFTKEYGLKYIIKKDEDKFTVTGEKSFYYSKNRKAEKLGYMPKYNSLECIIQESEEILKK